MTSNETKKKERWKTREQKYISEFTPRLQRDLRLFPTKEVQKEQEGRYIDLLWEGMSLYINGIVGCGKSLLAAKLLLKILEHSYFEIEHKINSYLFINTSEMLELIKKGFDNKEQEDIIEKCKTVDLLILDDIGVEKVSDWTFQMFYLLINYRYEHLIPIIFTSNLTKEQLGKKLGDHRLVSRITAMSEDVKMRDIDWRIKNKK